MKKSLFALAAVGAFAGAAQAQSSVTVYGILDVGYTSASSKVNGAVTNVSRIGNSMESGSRLGFRGNEDLGGGTAAQFVFELGMQPAGNAGTNPTGSNRAASNAAAGTYAGQGSSTWNPDVRQAFVGLSQKGLGTVRIGTQNTLFWEQGGSNTTGQLVQTIGSVLTPSSVGAFFDNGTTTTTLSGANSASYTVRTTNTVTLRTERMAGIMAKAAYTASNQTSAQTASTANGGYTGGLSNQGGWQVALDWNIQKANIQASYAAFKSDNPYTCATAPCTGTTAVTVGAPNSWGTGTQGTNVKDDQTLVTASYDFGILKAYAGWTQRKVTSEITSQDYLKRTAQEIGVRGYVTKAIEVWTMGGTGRWSAQGISQPTANFVGYQVGSNYWMSKRTNLYAIFGSTSTSSTSAGQFSASQASLGVRHTF